MLKFRILTAVILIPLFLLLLFKLPPTWFALLTGAVVLWSGWEWSALMGIKKTWKKCIYPVILFCVLYISLKLYIPNVIIASLIWWLLSLVLIVLYPKASDTWGQSYLVRGLMGFMVLIPCWLAVNFIRNIQDNGIEILLFLFILIWGADISAYFAGRWWGKHKLAPSVSPGKTWQGLIGAVVTTLVITLAVLFKIDDKPSLLWVGFCLVTVLTVLFSVVGDLFESMLKRKVNLKDSGHLLPGHGGILDRIDSLTAAAPVFLCGVFFLQKIFA